MLFLINLINNLTNIYIIKIYEIKIYNKIFNINKQYSQKYTIY